MLHCFLLTSSLFTAHLRSVTEKCQGTDIITVLTWDTSFFLCHLSCLDWRAVFGIMLSLLLLTSITSFLVNTASVDFCWDSAFLFFYHESWAKELYCSSMCLRNSQVWNDLCLRNESSSFRNRPIFPVVFCFLSSSATLGNAFHICLFIAVALQVETAKGFALRHLCKWPSHQVYWRHYLLEICLLRMRVHQYVALQSVKISAKQTSFSFNQEGSGSGKASILNKYWRVICPFSFVRLALPFKR